MKYSKNGYKRNSKDVKNPYNIIDSGDITMEGVDFPVMGMDNLGNEQIMMPGANYQFPGNTVFEVPLAQRGGSLPKAQDGWSDNFTWDNVKKAAELAVFPLGVIADEGLDYVKNSLADNIRPFTYHNPIARVEEALFSDYGENWIDKDWDHNEPGQQLPYNYSLEEAIERKDLLHMLLGLEQENNSILPSEYIPTKGHVDGDVYYSSPITETEIKFNYATDKGIDADGNYKNYGSILGNFKVDKGEDEKGTYVSYYDKWDLDPFDRKARQGSDWRQVATNFIQEHVLKTTPTHLYNRMYYTTGDDGEYVWDGDAVEDEAVDDYSDDYWNDVDDPVQKYGGSSNGAELPKAQNGVDYSITKQGYRPIDDQFFDSFQDRHYKCGESDGCILRPTRSLGYNTGDNSLFASYNPEIEVPLFGADRIRGGGTVFAGGLEGKGNLNYDFNTNKASFLTELTATGRLGFNKYGRRREGQGLVNPFTNKRMDEFDPKTEFGIQAGYDVLNNKMKDVGIYGRYGILDANLGYNLNNKQVQAGIGLRFQDGGSLPKAQAGINEFEINNFGHIETEKGYDEDALFEFAKDKYKKVNTASQKSDLVTKLNSPAFRQRYKKNIFNITGETLSEEELTNRINQQSDFTEAGPDFHVKMPYVTHTPNKGYKRSHTPYISPFSGYNADGEKVGFGQGKLEWRNNKGLYQQKNNNDREGNLFGSTYFSDVTNPDFPELAKYPYIPMLMDHRDPYIMGDNQVVPFDDANSTIVHEYAHSYNTDDSPLFNPAGKDFASVDKNKYDESGNLISKGNFSMLPGDKYKGWLSNLFGEDYFDEDKNKHGTWAMHPWEISSIKSETEAQLKNNNIWDNTKGEFGEGNLNNMLKLNSRLDLGGPEMDHLNRMGYSSLERMNYNNKRTIKNQDDANWSIDNNPNDYILDNIINAEDNASMDMDAFNTIFNNSQSNLKDKQKYSDYNSLLEDYTNGNKRKKKRATEIINTINKDVKNQINQGYNTENENYQIEYNKKKGEVLPKLEKYFNEIAMENGDQPTMAKFGGSLPKAQFGRNSIMSGNAYGVVPEGTRAITSGDVDGDALWDRFEKSSVGQFIDADGLADMFEMNGPNSLVAPFAQYFGYGDDDGKNFAYDATSMVVPAADFIRAGDLASEGNYTDAALYAGLGILPFSAGPLVKRVKNKVINPVKKFFGYGTDVPVVNKTKEMINPQTFDDAGNELFPTMTSDGTIQLRPRSNITRISRVEDAATTNADVTGNYETGNWYNNELTDFYNVNAKNADGNKIPFTYDRKVYTGNISEDLHNTLNVNNSTINAKSMSGGRGNTPLSTELLLPPNMQEAIRRGDIKKNELGQWMNMSIGSAEETSEILKDFYKKYGGSLPQFQKKGENSYQVEVIQYPLGYTGGQGKMPPGHIESRYLGDLTGTDYEGQKGYINRWVDEGNKPVSYNAETDYQDGVRTSILNLNKKEFDHYMNTAQTFTSGDKTDLPEFMGKDYRGNPFYLPTAWGGDDTDYDLVNSNCADGVCDALGLDGDYSTSIPGFSFLGGVTTPQQVMDQIIRDERTQSSTGNKNIGESLLQFVLNPIDETGYAIQDGVKSVYDDLTSVGTVTKYVEPTKEEIEEENRLIDKEKLRKTKGRTANLARGESYNEYGSIILNGNIIWKSPDEPGISIPTYKKEGGELPKAQEGEETDINFSDLEKGIKWSESLNGVLMKNKESSASGYYGDLFDNLDYDGTRDEFIADTDYQEDYFRKRAHGEIENIPGLINNGTELLEEYKDVDHNLSALEISALSNMLGRQGTRKYLGNVIRDGSTLEEVFPHLYGEDLKQTNKTPQEYIDKFNEGLLKKKMGGSVMTKVKRLNQQLDLYNNGGKISQFAKRELESLNMIKPKMQNGGQPPIEHHSYKIKRGDTLSTIARDNDISLSDLLSFNPSYMNDPSSIQPNQILQLSNDATPDNNRPRLKYKIKKGDTLSHIASKYGVRYEDIAKINNISDPRSIQPNQTIILPDNSNTTDPVVQENIKKAESVYVPSVNEVDVDSNSNVNVPWVKRIFNNSTGKWETKGKRNIKTEINKMDQADRIIQGMNDIEGDNSILIDYEIKSGDNLSLIAQKNGVTTKQLMTDNNISNANNIQVGKKIKIKKSSGKPYIVVDEKQGRMHLYYPGQDEPAKSYPILTGANEGDAQTVTKIGIFKDGVKLDQDALNQAMEDNLPEGTDWTVDNLLEFGEGYTSEADWDAGNKQTGAGIYTIGMINEDSGYYDDSGNNNPTPSFVLNNSNKDEVPMVIHTAPSKNDGRVENLNDNNASNNRVTNGCINGKCEDLTELYNTPGVGEGTMIYVLPEDAGNNFVFENGKINFYASSDNQTDYKKYTDERGEEQKGHGIANKTTTNYKPINITFDKNYYQTNSKRYDGTAAGEEEEFVNNTQPFLNSIVDNKKLLMDKLGMDGDMYNDLSMIAFGIYGYESGMGDEGSAGENFLKAGLKFTGVQDTSPDVKSKYNTYGVDSAGNSVGWTQIRWNQLDDTEKAALKKIDITSNDQLMDPANAAIATTAILYKRYQNQISRADKNSEDFDIFTALPKKWNKGEGYTDVVNTYMDYIDLTETDVDDVDNKLIVKGEYTDDNVASNQRHNDKDWKGEIEDFLNLPESIVQDYNSSEYVKPIVEGVKELAGDAKEWWDEVDLNPFWKTGGEFSVGNQSQFYTDYIDGKYKGTKQENKSKKMYDKLNRMYYNDSKKSNKHQLDIMNSILRSNR